MDIENDNKEPVKNKPTSSKVQGRINKIRNKRRTKKRNIVFLKEKKNKIVNEIKYFSTFSDKIEKAKSKSNEDLTLYLIQILKEENVLTIIY